MCRKHVKNHTEGGLCLAHILEFNRVKTYETFAEEALPMSEQRRISKRATDDEAEEEREPWRFIGKKTGGTSASRSAGPKRKLADTAAAEEQEPWMFIGQAKEADEGEAPVGTPPKPRPPSPPKSQDDVDLTTCLSNDYKTNSARCLSIMTSPDHFNPPDFKTWIQRPLAQQKPRDKSPGTPYLLTWFKEYPLLGYSAQTGEVFCRSCAMGCTQGVPLPPRATKELVSSPLKTSDQSRQTINRHYRGDPHTDGLRQCILYIQNNFKVPDPEPEVPLERYRILHTGLTSIVKVILFLGRQGLAFLGHKSKQHTINDQTPSMFASTDWSSGNFDALVDFRIESGDDDLKVHLQQSGGRSKYLHHSVQTKLITMTGRAIQKQILDEARSSRYFSVITDGATDISQKDQLTIVLRYLSQNRIREAFVAFIDISGTTRGRHIYRRLTRFFRRHRLDINRLRGLGADGAGNMAGVIVGVQRRLQRANPKALYVHCLAHKLSLAVFAHFSHQSVDDLKDFLETAGGFFNTPKRRKVIERNKSSSRGPRTLKRPIVTRWTEVGRVVRDLKVLYPAVLKSAKDIGSNTKEYPSAKARAVANGLATTMEKPSFAITLTMCVDVLGRLADVSKELQAKTLDYGSAVRLMHNTIYWIQDLITGLKDADGAYAGWFRGAKQLLRKHGKRMIIPPIRGKKKHYADPEVYVRPEAYFRETVVRPVLTGIRDSLKKDFKADWPDLLAISDYILPKRYLERARVTLFGAPDMDDWIAMYETYKNDIGKPKEVFDEEFERRVDYWQTKESVPQTVEEVLDATDSEFMRSAFSSMRTLIEIYAVTPVTSASAERSFSNMRLLKTYLRSSMATLRLMFLAILHIHKDRVVVPADIATEYLTVWGRAADVAGSLADKRKKDAAQDSNEDVEDQEDLTDDSDEDDDMSDDSADEASVGENDGSDDDDDRWADVESDQGEASDNNEEERLVDKDHDAVAEEVWAEEDMDIAGMWNFGPLEDAIDNDDLDQRIIGLDEFFFGLPT